MRLYLFSFLVISFSNTFVANAQYMHHPPTAKIENTVLEKHGDKRIDPYYWLKDRNNPQVIAYLEAENAYTKAIMQPTDSLQKKLFKEMKSRIKEDDSSVPFFLNGYWYQTQYNVGEEYPIYIRRKQSLETPAEVLFNVNTLAKGYAYYNFEQPTISEDNKTAAFGVDTISRRIYFIQFKNLETGNLYPEKIENTTGDVVWANDNRTVFYTRKDSTLRAYQIWKHSLGTAPEKDELVYEEKDNTYNCYVFKTKSKKFIFIGSDATLSNEYRFIPGDAPNAEWKIFQKRIKNLEYSIDHFNDYFYILTNENKATNFKLMQTPVAHTSLENWTNVIPTNPNILIEDIELFKNFLVVEERTEALLKIHIYKWDEKGNFIENYYLPFSENIYTAYLTNNYEWNTDLLRYAYTSMTTPWSTIDFNMSTLQPTVLKEQAVLGGKFDKKNYVTERYWVQSRDGKNIPISMVRNKTTTLSPKTPLLQYGYGSYGHSLDPGFSSVRLSLLDRGFVYVIAHIRGGQELGRSWYEDGKFFNKKNTFNDFIDVSKFLIKKQYTSPQHLYAMGGSAGGLLMGVVANEAPELYKGMVAQVPFVDVITTMLDESIPLTTGEYDEWGNPNDKAYYDYIKSYSPYDNVQAKNYPNILVTTGLHDSQVQYWEPAKWVASMRTTKTNNNLLLLECNMRTGHSGASGRFESLKEIALEYAFLLMLEGVLE